MRSGAKVVVVFPPVQVSPDFIDYPYFADLGAIQAAAVLRAAGADVTLADAFALPGSTLISCPPPAALRAAAPPKSPAPPAQGGDRSSFADSAPTLRESGAPANRGQSSNGAGGDLLLGAPEDDLFAAIPAAADVFVVAITPFHRPPARDAALGGALARLRREHPGTPIVLADLYQSGQHVVDAASADIAASYPEIDVLVRFESETDLPAIVGDLVDRGLPSEPRLAVGTEPPRLDTLPLPAWDLVDLPAYFAFHERVTARLGRPDWAFPITGQSAPALTSRGCPYRCVHCSSNPSSRREGVQIAPKTQRRYSPDYLDRLFADLAARGVRRVHLLDELTNVNEAHFDAVLDLLGKHRLSFEIPNGLRADYLLPRHLERMRGRLTTLSVSAESGVQRVVDRVVDKQLDLAAIRTAAADARAARVPLLVHFMIGLPGETREDIQGTLRFALALAEQHGALPSMQFATPLPGTRLAKLAADSALAAGREDASRDTASDSALATIREDATPNKAADSTADATGNGAPPRRPLPLVRDWGPLFQQHPSTSTSAFTPEYLAKTRRTFDRRMRALEAPKRVVLNLTYRCNNRCPFCTTGTHDRPDVDHARQRTLLVEHRKRGATALDIDGGEPTLEGRLFPIIAFARKIGYDAVTVTTNGRMASYPSFAEKLVSSGATSLFVSLHGPDAATHTENVGAPDAFDQTCAGIRHLVRLASPSIVLGAKFTVTRSNQDKLFETATLIEHLGLRHLDIQLLTPFGPSTPSIAPDLDTAAREVARTLAAFEGRLQIRVSNLPPCLLPGHEDAVIGDDLDLAGRLSTADDEVDPLAYLRARRVKKPVCESCPHTLGCRGFYETAASPAPPWLIPAESLSRRPDAPPLALDETTAG